MLLTFSIDLGPRHVRIMSEIACRHSRQKHSWSYTPIG